MQHLCIAFQAIIRQLFRRLSNMCSSEPLKHRNRSCIQSVLLVHITRKQGQSSASRQPCMPEVLHHLVKGLDAASVLTAWTACPPKASLHGARWSCLVIQQAYAATAAAASA